MPVRKIIEIDEERCDGCGACIPSCAEGALEIIDGKAKVVRDMYCDGLGACLGACPQDALRIIEREAEEFDEEAAMEYVRQKQQAQEPQKPLGCGCPGSAAASFEPAAAPKGEAVEGGSSPSALSHWPVKLKLVPPEAPFIQGRDLVLAADCAPVALAGFNPNILEGKAVLIACPKFDDVQAHYEKLKELFAKAKPRSVQVLRMEVPCCTGLSAMAHQAAREVGADFEVEDVVITRKGDMKKEPAEALL